jgi:hypothetical protein
LKSEKEKEKIKMEGQRSLGGEGGVWLLILKRILDEIKIRLKKVENLTIMINDTKAPNGKN